MTTYRANSIGRLLKERFPEYFVFLQQHENIDHILTVVGLDGPEQKSLEKAQVFHRELVNLSDEQLHKADIQRKLRSIHERDASHPLNAFPYEAYDKVYEFYAKAAVWTVEEAAALLVGRDPRRFNLSTLKRFRTVPKSADEYREILDLLERACSVRQLNRTDRPSQFLSWAERVGQNVPHELKKLVLQFSRQTASAPIPDPNLEERQTKGDTKADAIGSQDGSQPLEKDLKQRERTSLLKLVIGMAIGGYVYDPTAKRYEAVPDIRDDLERIGLPLDEQTIRHLALKMSPQPRCSIPASGGSGRE